MMNTPYFHQGIRFTHQSTRGRSGNRSWLQHTQHKSTV